MKNSSRKHHYTLMEILVVCGIILILAGISIGVYSMVNRKMQDARCQAMIAKMCVAMENYKSKMGYYYQAVTASALYIDPYGSTTDYTLNKEIDIPASELGGTSGGFGSGTLLNRGAWKDPWGREFRYQCPGSHNRMSFDLYSSGEDKIFNTADDITNWKQ